MQVNAQYLAELIELPDAVMYGVAKQTYAVFEPAVTVFDKLLHENVPAMADLDKFVASNIHPLSKRLPLMNPTYVLFGVVMYAVLLISTFVIGKILGKLKHKPLGFVHNMFLYFLSLYMCTSILITAVASGYSLWNNGVHNDANAWRMAKLIWLFYVSKLPEFGDTCLMMLKHNYHQVSFLHLYHHLTIFVIWFIVTLVGPGGEAYFSAMLNSFIHVIMYGYYWGTMMFDETSSFGRFLKNFKFMITKGQMTQFALNCLQSTYDLVIVKQSNYPTALVHLLLWYMFTLLGLFGNFLIQGQRKAAAERRSKKAAAEGEKKKK